MKTIQAECPTCHRVISGVVDGETLTCDFMPGFNAVCNTKDVFECSLKQAIAQLKAMDPRAQVTHKKHHDS